MEHITNSITLRGILQELPQFSHENHCRRFYRFTLSVERLSGAVDQLPVIAEEALIMNLDPCGGEMIRVEGQIRSHNYRTESGRRLLVFVFATSVLSEDGEPLNDCVIEGPICKEPTFRRTPLGREIADLLIAVNRPYGKSDYIPCICWGRNARFASSFEVGTRCAVWGRIQSREYMKKLSEETAEKRVAYEVSVNKLDLIDEELQVYM